jgi:hypothetical protein
MSRPVAYVLLDGPVTLNERALVETLRQSHRAPALLSIACLLLCEVEARNVGD